MKEKEKILNLKEEIEEESEVRKEKMKPKNRVFCHLSGRAKMAFSTQSKAEDFIRYNSKDFEGKVIPVRAYYCVSCCAWHITHTKRKKNVDDDIKDQEKVLERAIDGLKSKPGSQLEMKRKEELEKVRSLYKEFSEEIVPLLSGSKAKSGIKEEELLSLISKMKDIKANLEPLKSSKDSVPKMVEQIDLFIRKAFSGLYFKQVQRLQVRFRQVFSLVRYGEPGLALEQVRDVERDLGILIDKLGIDEMCKCEVMSLQGELKRAKGEFLNPKPLSYEEETHSNE